MKQKQLKLLGLSLVAGIVSFFMLSGTSSAASIDVAAGADAINDNGICQLSEAITNINDQVQTHDDCVETGVYGTDDTIALPTGTITLTADLPELTESVSIEGEGMDTTTIDGDGAYEALACVATAPNITLSVTGLTVTAYELAAVSSFGCNLVVSQLEADGTNAIVSPSLTIVTGVSVIQPEIYEISISVTDTYIHNLQTSSDDTSAVGVNLAVGGVGSALNVDVNRVTIDNIMATGGGFSAAATGINFQNAASNSQIEGRVGNVTITSIGATQARANGITMLAVGDDVHNNVLVENATIVDIQGITSVITPAALALIGATNSVANINLEASNVVIADAINCSVTDIGTLFGSTGTPDLNLSSSGGNLSDDDTCSEYFNHSTDQNNVSALADTLGPLSDNGGYVPTIPLLEGSLAIDAGVTVLGLSTDARLAARPQGNAFDSGAYESPFSRDLSGAEDSDGSLANSGDSTTTLATLLAASILTLTGMLAYVTRKRVYRLVG